MAHHDLWGWADVESLAQNVCRSIKGSLIRAQEQYLRWLAFKGADNDATIAAANGWRVEDVTKARLALEAVNEIHSFASGSAGTQGDRLTPMRKVVFSFGSNGLLGMVKTEVRSLADALVAGQEVHQELLGFAQSRTDAQLATALGAPATEALVADVRVSVTSANQAFQYANNNATFGGTRDRLADWRILT